METLSAILAAGWTVETMLLIGLGVVLGLVFGLLPGVGGLTSLALLLPFIFGMAPLSGLAFLLSMHAVICTGGSVTAILLGIPGSIHNVATVTDGFALSQRGRAALALGVALSASAFGGVVGVLVLLALLPVLQQVVHLFGSPETFLLALLGIVFVGALGESRPLRGLIAGAVGIFLGTYGYHAATGVPRFWMEWEYLLDGFRLIPLALGLFAVPEIVELMSSRESIAGRHGHTAVSRREVWRGVSLVYRRLRLALRSALIGVLVGIIPGAGGETAPFAAYAVARQTSRRAFRFGRGAVEGVLAPEASNNAKEGGALVPTFALGVPGSAGMSLILGGFMIVGLDPGPSLLEDHLDLALSLSVVVALANVMAALVLLWLAPWLSVVTRLDGRYLAPVLLVLVVLGSYAPSNDILDVMFVLIFGALGLLMKRYAFSRPALVLGFVLGAPVETYFQISVNAYGPSFLARPLCVLILAAIAAGIFIGFRRSRATSSGG